MSSALTLSPLVPGVWGYEYDLIMPCLLYTSDAADE